MHQENSRSLILIIIQGTIDYSYLEKTVEQNQKLFTLYHFKKLFNLSKTTSLAGISTEESYGYGIYSYAHIH